VNLIDTVRAATSADWNFLTPKSGSSATWQGLVTGIIGVMLMFAGGLAVIYLIYSGILYITAAGNPDSAKKGQQGIINAIIGIVIIVLAYVILRAVSNLATGVNTSG